MTNAPPYACYGQDIRVGEIIKLTSEQVWLSCLLRSDIDTLAKTSVMHFAWDHRWMIDQAVIAARSALPSLAGSSWQARARVRVILEWGSHYYCWTSMKEHY